MNFLPKRIIDPVPLRLFLYNVIVLVLGILTLPWVLYQLAFVKKRRQGLAHRFGRTPVADRKTIWCHAVSVGEVRAVSPMLSLLQEDEKARDRIVLSTVTVTGQETANRECGFVSQIFYFPLDLPFIPKRAVSRLKPEVFITVETEIWPNFFNACFKRGVPVILVNGRISDNSYSRYRKFRWFFKPVLQMVSLFLMQSEEDAQRIRDLGARPETVKMTGNMKYDRVPEPVTLPDSVKEWAKGRFLFVAGSTHAGEEEIVLEAIASLVGLNILLGLVPRHPERFDEVVELLKAKGITYTKYTDILSGQAVNGNVVLVDAMGVLDGFYALADAAFVGGSMVPVGGHNLLEPAMHGIPVLTGPYTHNFRDITSALLAGGGCTIVADTGSMGEQLTRFLKNRRLRDKMGHAARMVSEETSGASGKNVETIIQLLNQ